MKKTSEKIEEIDTRIELSCPNCGTLISKSDKYCRKCGVNLAGSSTPPSEELPQEIYERKLSD
jgi:ribosomal protein L37AE/L43A